MNTPADGWDRDEREALEELRDALAHAGEASLSQADQDRLLARIYRGAQSRSPGQWSWLRPALATAALVVVVAGAWLALRREAPAPSPGPPEQAIVATPKPAPFQIPLDKPEVMLSLSALTWRGSTGTNPLLADLKDPLDAFRADDYARADHGFTALAPRYPDAVEVFFYAGVARLFEKDADGALTALTRAGELADATFAPRVAWYRAIAEQRTGRAAEARTRLDVLCRGGSDRAAAACAALKHIDAGGVPNAR
jgi:hypothetical protein